jgi:hypothetical protein
MVAQRRGPGGGIAILIVLAFLVSGCVSSVNYAIN